MAKKRHEALRISAASSGTSLRCPKPHAAQEAHEAYLTFLADQMQLLHELDPSKDIDFVTAFVILQHTNISQKHLAVAVGISPATLSRWGKGEHLPERIPVRAAYMDEVAKAMAAILQNMPKRPGTKHTTRAPRRLSAR